MVYMAGLFQTCPTSLVWHFVGRVATPNLFGIDTRLRLW